MKITIVAIILMLPAIFSRAQNTTIQHCGAQEHLEFLFKENPFLQTLYEEQNVEKTYFENSRNSNITIPIIFHIVYANTSQNPSDAELQILVEGLTQDFRRQNSNASATGSKGYFFNPSISLYQAQFANYNSLGADIGIEFCFYGVTRQTNSYGPFSVQSTTYNMGGDVKSIKDIYPHNPAYPASQFYHVWITDIVDFTGYATFPSYQLPPQYDGVVIDYETVVQSNPNYRYTYRTLTHETGHWLGLYHTFGNGSSCGTDNVSDTYPVEHSNLSSQNNIAYQYSYANLAESDPCFSWNACSGFNNYFNQQTQQYDAFPYVGMIDNYMDYTNSDCQNFFSQGQKQRMLYILNNERRSIANNSICNGNPIGIKDLENDFGMSVMGEQLQIIPAVRTPIKVRFFDITGKECLPEVAISEKTLIDIDLLPTGLYFACSTIGSCKKFIKE